MPAQYRFGPFRLQPARRLLLRGEQPVRLGARAFDLLAVLVRHPGRVQSNDALMAQAWPGVPVEAGSLRMHVAALRRALAEGAAAGDPPRYIDNVPLRGYCFVAPVLQEDAGDAAAAPPPAPRQPPPLPAPPATLHGRDADLDALAARLPQRRFVTVVGAGGAGKTSLALALARRLAADGTRAACFVDLAAIASPQALGSAVASALALPAVAEDPLPAILAALQARPVLLLLDNCEHVLDAAAPFAERAVAEVPGLWLLATSREPLRSRGEAVHRLAPLACPPPAAADAATLLASPAVQLFLERAEAADEHVPHDDAGALAQVGTLCRGLDGMPLAIELAAAHAGALGVAALAGEVARFAGLGVGGRRTATPRHQTLRAAIAWSHDRLPPDERRALRRLAVFPAGFGLDGAAAVLGPDGGASPLQPVSALALKSLLQVDAAGAGPPRYRLLETTRAFALEQLRAAGEEDVVRERHAGFVAARLQAAGDAADGPGLDDARAAIAWWFAEPSRTAAAVTLVADAARLWFRHGLIGEYRALADQAGARMPGCAGLPEATRLRLQAALGQALVHAAGPGSPRLVEVCTEGLALAQRLGDAVVQRQMIFRLWNASVVNGGYEDALAWAHRHAQACEASADEQDRLVQHRMQLLSLHTVGRHADALAHGERVLAHPGVVARTLPRRSFEVDHRTMALAFTGRALWLLGRPEQAWARAREAVDESLAAGQAQGTLYALGVSACLVGLWVGALDETEHYVGLLAERAAAQSLVVWTLWAQCFDAALVRRGRVPPPRPPVPAARGVASNTMQQEVYATLVEGAATDLALRRALDAGERVWSAAEVLRSRAVALLAAGGDAARADGLALLQRADTIAQAQQALAWRLRIATTRARLLADTGERAAAVEVLAPVLDAFTEGHATQDLRSAAALLAQLA